MLKRVLPWALIFAVILVVLQIAVEHTPEETGTGLWKWRYVAIIVAVVLGFPAACAWCYDRGKAKGIASVPVVVAPEVSPTPKVSDAQEARIASAHTWMPHDQLQYMVREIATNVLKPDHSNAERAGVDLQTLERRHHVWYDERAHSTREQFAGVVKNILRVRRDKGVSGLYGDLSNTEVEVWNRHLVTVRGNLLASITNSKQS